MTTNNAQAPVELKAEDLPAYCPNPNMPLWSSHPKVFLDMSHGGKATCPYCGTLYQLAPGTVIKGH
ncbi:zinc-finger domain-containing protein [Undibacterium luofuense]|uniref:zinc-finger domain-containing protein n=1 Tax=Undibacterium luofuense TaxID=2828733 RepID=UPI0030EE1811